jgi:hypothetical protein
MTSVIAAYTAVEAFANESIPDDYVQKHRDGRVRQRHRDRFARFRLIRVNPRDAPHQVDLRPLQPGHVGAAQSGFETEL